MFVLRCLGVSLSFFLLMYAVLSLAVMRGWKLMRRMGRRLASRRWADLLFVLRSAPLIVAALVTLGIVLPSFLLLEPRVVSEPIGEVPLTLGACCLLLFGVGVWKTVGVQRSTSRTVMRWLEGATRSTECYPVPLFRTRPPAPALAVAGVRFPRVLLSDAAAALLSDHELQTALKHELVHVRRRDNLKKLLFRVCAMPGMAGLETAWSEATEMAADDAAVSSSREALDLASALIKLSRFAPLRPTVITTALVEGGGSLLNARVERLMTWDATRTARSGKSMTWYLATSLCGTVVGVMMSYGFVLSRIHQLTEWLVR